MTKTKKCPVCGTSTKVENLEKHVKKVHPGTKIELDFTDKEQMELKRAKVREKELSTFSTKKVLAAIIVLIVAVSAVLAYTSIQNDAGSGKLPNVVFDHSTYELGTMMDPSTIYHDFAFENTGPGTLVIDKVQTSCHCTTVVLEIDGSPEGPFGMDGSPSGWKGHVAPGESVVLKVSYDTFYHGASGDLGEQTRIINLYTNDPSYPVLKFELMVFIARS